MDSDSTAWKMQGKRRQFERKPFDFVWKLVDEDRYIITLHLYMAVLQELITVLNISSTGQ
jgi:hypothetical protein